MSDEALIEVEVFNKNPFDVVWHRDKSKDDYVRGAGITPGPDFIENPAGTFCIRPTAYYYFRAFDAGHMHDLKREIKDVPGVFTQNYGDSKRIGNTLPSAPDVKVRQKRIR
ncbi:MAG: hypothetical protein HC883_01045 [Bdellovibrionaceae bacterium]|nr:hypothetical protein [Pseudobdellovibrionaceae bacterium]